MIYGVNTKIKYANSTYSDMYTLEFNIKSPANHCMN